MLASLPAQTNNGGADVVVGSQNAISMEQRGASYCRLAKKAPA
jgi:hypothetical protein